MGTRGETETPGARAAAGVLPAFQPVGIGALLRVKQRALINHMATALAESPLKLLGTVGFVVLIWFGLYGLFYAMFEYLSSQTLEAVVAVPLLFSFFFVALLVLLTFSNAILAYSALYDRNEAVYLLTAPLAPRAVVTIKYLEVLFFSSWSVILLGLPLMMAVAKFTPEPDLFYPLFLALFLFFVPIPGAAGLVVAWLAACYLPRSARKTVFCVVAAAAMIGTIWGLRFLQRMEGMEADWLSVFLFRMDFVQSALLPSTWITRGVEHAMHDRLDQAVMYLLLLAANALFLSWLAIVFTGDRLLMAIDRASVGRSGAARLPASASGGVLGAVFCYLPHPVRLIAVKDLRTFLRDPLQWSQLAILVGLMALYLVNMPRFQVELLSERWALAVPLLNFGAIGFILATFTSRFVFPLVSLEGHQFWLLGLLPMERRRLLQAKFAFAMTVSVTVGVGAMALAAVVLRIAAAWVAVHLVVTFALCVGLCGMAVGVGARMPVLHQRNPARIASGFGGTVNLLASVGLVVGALASFGLLSLRAFRHQLNAGPDLFTVLSIVGIACGLMAAGLVALGIGARHLQRMEA